MMGDGMVSMGSVIVKPNAKKIRRIKSKAVKANAGGDPLEGKVVDVDADDGASDTIVGFAVGGCLSYYCHWKCNCSYYSNSRRFIQFKQ